MRAAYKLAERVLPEYSSKFSRRDFTLPQLFACLVVREHQKKTYRGTEELLRDCPDWLADIGLDHAPDHNTLCNAFKKIVNLKNANAMLDVTAEWFTEARVLDLTKKPLTADSTYFESHHVSKHFEKRRKETAAKDALAAKTEGGQGSPDGTKPPEKPGPPDKSGSRTRPRTTKLLPKATFAVAAACHLVLAVTVDTGAGSDAPAFGPLLYDAWRRAPVKTIVADAGFDSEENHRTARLDMTVRSIIPPEIGRPRKDGGPPSGKYRKLMHDRFKRKADKAVYGQRWQSETVNSMIKRNLGSALRARTPEGRECEMLLRTLTHNIMLA